MAPKKETGQVVLLETDAIRPGLKKQGLRLTTRAQQFRTGPIVITSQALLELSIDDILTAIERHMTGDWGELDEFDWKVNDAALEYGDRLLSRYRARQGIWFWIITEADRSLTTVLLPGEY